MKYCLRCNQYYDDNTAFCGRCKGQLSYVQQPPQPQMRMPQQPQMPQGAGMYNQPQAPRQTPYGAPGYGQPQPYGASAQGAGLQPGTKKMIFIIAAAVVVVGLTMMILGVTGVFGGGSGGSDQLVGSWVTSGNEFTYTFNADGTGRGASNYYYESYDFNWSKSGNTISLTSPTSNDSAKWNIVSISDTEMVVTVSGYDSQQMTLRKISGGASSNSGGYY